MLVASARNITWSPFHRFLACLKQNKTANRPFFVVLTNNSESSCQNNKTLTEQLEEKEATALGVLTGVGIKDREVDLFG
jgi:hypothetical protein